MKTLLLSLFLLAGTYTVSLAQTKSEYSIALKKMLDASGALAGQKVAMTQMIGTLKKQKNLPAEFWTSFEKRMDESLFEELFQLMVPVYQKHLSLQEVKQLTVFYQSPLGSKLSEKTPLIMAESMTIASEWGRKLGEELVAEMKKKGM